MTHGHDRSYGAEVVLEALEKHFDARRVLQGVDLRIAAGEFVAIVGRSGSGKSTLLRILSGLEQPTAGSLRVQRPSGADATGTVRMVFQEPRLLPWKSVLENVWLGMQGRDRAHARAVLAAVGLADRVDEYPAVLSGGQRQRVAFARALVHDPDVMLLDEPFGALDALTRIEAQRLIERLWVDRRFTAVLVTHDVSEAVLLADRVLLVEDGRIAARFQVDLPRPRRRENADVARISGAVLDAIFDGPEAGPIERCSQRGGTASVSGVRRTACNGGASAERSDQPLKGLAKP